ATGWVARAGFRERQAAHGVGRGLDFVLAGPELAPAAPDQGQAMNAARLRMTPASRSVAATPKTPRWAGISTTTRPPSSAGAGVKTSQTSTVASTAAPRVRALGRGRNPMILRV